jgi:aldose 1-epimerase
MKMSTQIYQQTVEKFGDFNLIKISNGVNEIALVPEYGGHLVELNMIVNGQLTNVLDSYSTPEELIEQDYYKNSFLLPYPNRLKDGVYSYNGKTYTFPINDKGTQNSLHGFKDFYKMSVESIITDEDYASITLKSDYQGQNPAFPFPFEFKITYTLKGYNELVCSIDLYNPTNETMPIGFGWHPYFKLGNLPVEELELQMPTVDQVLIDDRMLPTGEFKSVDTYNSLTNLTGKNFDTCFKAIDGNLSEVVINAPSINTKLSYWQENEAFPYFQVFIPPKRKSIAIEPMTCNVNAFNRPDDLKELNGNERLTGKFGVLVTGY